MSRKKRKIRPNKLCIFNFKLRCFNIKLVNYESNTSCLISIISFSGSTLITILLFTLLSVRMKVGLIFRLLYVFGFPSGLISGMSVEL